MAANQVVLYFDKQEDALLFTLAASSAISADGPLRVSEAGARIAREISKASRITTEGAVNTANGTETGRHSAQDQFGQSI